MSQKKKAKFEISAGGIVFREEKEGIKFFLIKDSYGRWALPKGHVEEKEKPEEAAKREIKEEVGLSDLKVIQKLDQVKYFFRLKGELIFKIVYNFLIETSEEKLKSSWEIQDAQWFSPQKALSKIAYKNTKPILEKAIKILREGRKNEKKSFSI